MATALGTTDLGELTDGRRGNNGLQIEPKLASLFVVRSLGLQFRNEWKTFWMFDGFNGKVDIQIRPIQMLRVRELDIQYGANWRVFEPRKLHKWHEKLTSI